MNNEYRIREHCGIFEIEIKGYKEKGILWWKKKEWDWYRVNIWGGVIQAWPVVQPICESFNTLEAARKRMNGFKKGATYYYK